MPNKKHNQSDSKRIAMKVNLSDIKDSTINISGQDILNVNAGDSGQEGHVSKMIQDELLRQRKMISPQNGLEAKLGVSAKRRLLRVFLCHSSGDKPFVRKLYLQLRKEAWIDPWLDEEKLLPGEDWDFEIKKAVSNSDAIIVCLSKDAVNKEGYVQKEISLALDIAEEKPEGSIFILPIKLNECLVPRRLNRWQWLNLFQENAYNKLIAALEKRGKSLDIIITN